MTHGRTTTAYIGLGSNIGPRASNLLEAVERLDVRGGLAVERVSSVYQTAPQGPVTAQPDFLNAVAEVETTLPAPALLEACLAVEQQMGRQRLQPKGPRTIDLDLLLVGSVVGHWPGLELPHAALAKRAFVLHPLLELDPALRDPRTGDQLDNKLPLVRDQRLARLGTLAPLAEAEHAGQR